MIEGLPLADIGYGAIVTLVILLVLTGKLVPRRVLEDAFRQRDNWQAAAERKDETIGVLSQQVGELVLEHAKSTEQLIRALPQAVTQARQEGGG